jgi:hypothetical protein
MWDTLTPIFFLPSPIFGEGLGVGLLFWTLRKPCGYSVAWLSYIHLFATMVTQSAAFFLFIHIMV